MNNKGRIVVISVIAIVVVVCLLLVVFIQTKGKGNHETTNKSEDMVPANRGDADTIKEDLITYDGMEVSYELPSGFYFEYENDYEISGQLKEYMNHNYNKSIEVTLYKVHEGEFYFIDSDNSESVEYNENILKDGNEWLREMQLVYSGTDGSSTISEVDVSGNSVRYFVKYEKNEDGVMQGMLAGVITINDEFYYCVTVTEFDEQAAPDLDNYKNVFSIKY